MRGIMEKICIVKRRKIGHEAATVGHFDSIPHQLSDPVTIQLTLEQANQIRSNKSYINLCTTSETPIFLTLRPETLLPPKMLKPQEVCGVLQVSVSTLTKMVKSGMIKSYRVGRLRRFRPEDLMEYLARGVEETDLIRAIHNSPFMRFKKNRRSAL
jgi:excisionase family DNA binding protein